MQTVGKGGRFKVLAAFGFYRINVQSFVGIWKRFLDSDEMQTHKVDVVGDHQSNLCCTHQTQLSHKYSCHMWLSAPLFLSLCIFLYCFSMWVTHPLGRSCCSVIWVSVYWSCHWILWSVYAELWSSKRCVGCFQLSSAHRFQMWHKCAKQC